MDYHEINSLAVELAYEAYVKAEGISGDPALAYAMMQNAQNHWLQVFTAREHLKTELFIPPGTTVASD